MSLRSDYSNRLISQSLKWVNGISVHNTIDNECVPDYSCCRSGCFNPSRKEREAAHNRLVAALDQADRILESVK